MDRRRLHDGNCCAREHAHANEFEIGLQGGFAQWKGKSGDSDEDATGGSFGVVARYTVPVDDNGIFVGLHLAGSAETASHSDSGSIADEASINWSADILARIGHDLGGAVIYVAGGMAFAGASIEASADNVEIFNDSQVHVGWKVALGLDVAIAENWSFFTQAEYGGYGEKEYSDQGLVSDLDLNAITGRVGVLYRF